MVKWYNASLPRTSWEFDSPWPHTGKICREEVLKAITVDNFVDMCIKDTF
jgi:hypothetical protein